MLNKQALLLPEPALRLVFYLQLIAVFILACLPVSDSPLFSINDKLLHSLTFLVLGAFFLASHRKNPTPLLQLTLLALYGLLIEATQSLLDYREADIFDIVADLFGLAICYGGFGLYQRRRQKSP